LGKGGGPQRRGPRGSAHLKGGESRGLRGGVTLLEKKKSSSGPSVESPRAPQDRGLGEGGKGKNAKGPASSSVLKGTRSSRNQENEW